MIFELGLLATKTGEFSQDILLPAAVGTVVVIMLANALLYKWGYQLW